MWRALGFSDDSISEMYEAGGPFTFQEMGGFVDELTYAEIVTARDIARASCAAEIASLTEESTPVMIRNLAANFDKPELVGLRVTFGTISGLAWERRPKPERPVMRGLP